jgi:predicted site-specific integrase-resolvase
MQVVGYIRVSTEDQAREGVSLAAQRAKIDAYALVKDWRVVEVIQDDMTAKHLRRRGVQRLLELVAFSVNRRNFGRQRIYPLSHNDLGGLSENEG